MDFIKQSINDAGERAAKEALVDQATNSIKGALGDNGNNKLVDQASSFVKSTFDNKDGSHGQTTQKTTEATFLDQAQNVIKQTVTKESTTTDNKEGGNSKNDGNAEKTEKTTIKTDYVDKGISLVEEKVFNISADKQNHEQNEKIAGYVRTGIEKLTHGNNGGNSSSQ